MVNMMKLSQAILSLAVFLGIFVIYMLLLCLIICSMYLFLITSLLNNVNHNFESSKHLRIILLILVKGRNSSEQSLTPQSVTCLQHIVYCSYPTIILPKTLIIPFFNIFVFIISVGLSSKIFMQKWTIHLKNPMEGFFLSRTSYFHVLLDWQNPQWTLLHNKSVAGCSSLWPIWGCELNKRDRSGRVKPVWRWLHWLCYNFYFIYMYIHVMKPYIGLYWWGDEETRCKWKPKRVFCWLYWIVTVLGVLLLLSCQTVLLLYWNCFFSEGAGPQVELDKYIYHNQTQHKGQTNTVLQ